MFGIFGKKQLQKPGRSTVGENAPGRRRLIDVVERKTQTKLSAFEDINRDLGAFIDQNSETCDPVAKMAYAYARRTAVAGLFFQGIIKENAVKHVQDIFEAFQKITGQTVAFQREAASQAIELVQSYIVEINTEVEKVLVNYAREGVTALELADNEAFGFEIDELEENPVCVETCIALINRVLAVAETLGMGLRPALDPNRQKRLIDVVEKTSQAKLGPFASMCEDVQSSAQSFRGDNILFASSGYALILGACGGYVAGGVHPKLISDYTASAKTLIAAIGNATDVHQICRQQAIALASTYVFSLTREAAEIIIETGLKLDVFRVAGESRLSPEEVVLRAKRIARTRSD